MAGRKSLQPTGRRVGIVFGPVLHDRFKGLDAQLAFRKSRRPGGSAFRLGPSPTRKHRYRGALLRFAARQLLDKACRFASRVRGPLLPNLTIKFWLGIAPLQALCTID